MKKIERPYSEAELREMYLKNMMTSVQISQKFGFPLYLVERDLSRLKIGRSPKCVAEATGMKKRIAEDELYQYYIIENHTTEEAAEHFGVNERTIRRRLREYGIAKSLNLQQQAAKRKQEEIYGSLFVHSDYYREKVRPHMLEKMRQTCRDKYNVDSVMSLKETQEKIKNTRISKYGVPYYTQTEEYHHKTKRHYFFDGEYFDSSWELALWIFAKDHGEEISRCPCSFEYVVDGKVHKYFPDFMYKNELIEIKGDFLLDNKMNLVDYNSVDASPLTHAKDACMRKHGVKLYTSENLSYVFNYIAEKYGQSYLKHFRMKKQ